MQELITTRSGTKSQKVQELTHNKVQELTHNKSGTNSQQGQEHKPGQGQELIQKYRN
ncbi:hypothetical protein HYD71_03780 [Mycoplasmopsis bovis]|nr:hypothetical protein [Mycoplasmopsis bovis]QQH49617.1 hypothetical protein HYD71_03780 [Mycoplasmopsis bovis]